MSVLENVLTAIRFKRKQQALSVQDSYAEMVAALARGEQIDVDELATVLDALDKSDTELAADVAEIPKRAKRIDLVARGEAAAKRSQAIEVEIEQLQRELDEVCRPITAKINLLADEHRACEHIATAGSVAKRELSENVSPQLRSRESELNTELRSLVAQEQTILARVPKKSAEQPLLEEIAKRQKNLAGMQNGVSADRTEFEQRQIDDAEWALSNHRSTRANCESQLATVRARISEIQGELAKLSQRKFTAQ